MELNYRLWNPSQLKTPKIVLLHGMGGTGALWRPLAAAIENEIIVMAPDQRGHGQSIIPAIPGARTQASYTPLDYGQDVVDTLKAASFHPTWILGHSMGVRTAVATAHLQKEWVRGLILVDLGFTGPAGGGLGEGLASFLKKLPAEFPSRSLAREFMQKYCPDPSIAQYLMAVSTQGSNGTITFPFDHAALIQTIYSTRDASVRPWVEELCKAQMPIHVLRGQNSLVWSHDDFELEKAYFSKFPNIHFAEVPDAGHGLPFEQRMWIADFIKQVYQ